MPESLAESRAPVSLIPPLSAAEQAALHFRSWWRRAEGLLRALGVRPCDREDILQEAFVALLLNSGRALNPEAYFFCAIRTKAIDRRRERKRRVELELDLEAEAAPELCHPNDRIDLDRLVASLRPTDRQLLFDRFFLGKSHQEIAAEHGISDESMRKRQLRALSEVRLRVRRSSVSIEPPG